MCKELFCIFLQKPNTIHVLAPCSFDRLEIHKLKKLLERRSYIAGKYRISAEKESKNEFDLKSLDIEHFLLALLYLALLGSANSRIISRFLKESFHSFRILHFLNPHTSNITDIYIYATSPVSGLRDRNVSVMVYSMKYNQSGVWQGSLLRFQSMKMPRISIIRCIL